VAVLISETETAFNAHKDGTRDQFKGLSAGVILDPFGLNSFSSLSYLRSKPTYLSDNAQMDMWKI